MTKLLAPFVLALGLLATPALAAQESAFSPAAFKAAQAHNEAILVEVAAPWCPICRSQQATLKKLTAGKAYGNLHILRIDFDTQKAAWQGLHVARQGTLIAFRGGHEVDRVNFQTDEGVIRHALDAATR